MTSLIPQIAIPVLGGIGAWLTGSGRRRVRFWGFVAGLSAQPFWFWMLIETRQIGVGILSVWYTVSWIRGILNNRRQTQIDAKSIEAVRQLWADWCEYGDPNPEVEAARTRKVANQVGYLLTLLETSNEARNERKRV